MIAVLMGGFSAEREISLKSGTAVLKALQNNHIDCFSFDLSNDNLDELWSYNFDKAFIMLHGRGGEDGFIQKHLENRNIPYTGSDSKSSKICMNKASTKAIWSKHNLPLAPSVLAKLEEQIPSPKFSLPWAVKPILEGSSIGVSKVLQHRELNSALKLAWKYDDEALVEKWIEGDEYTVSIVNNKALPIIKIIAGCDFYDYESKYFSNSTKYQCPCGLTPTQEEQMQALALKAFWLTGASGWGRIDFIMDAQQPYLLEANTVPGMTNHSLVPTAAKAFGINFDTLVMNILNG